MLLGHRSTTCMVDIFSMGCLYYYLLTNGKHPFGENFHRQANILGGKNNLSHLDPKKQSLETSLIKKMIAFEPNDRPPAVAVLKHPAFWSKDKTITFLQDVSDRVDKEDDDSYVLGMIEKDSMNVTRGDWHYQLDSAVREDLRKHRTYKGRSVRDLLRAIRNKKHHYRELTDDAKLLYGKMPGEFTDYWVTRFPLLVSHSYLAMQCVKYENNFSRYYHKDYDYVPIPHRSEANIKRETDLDALDVDLISPKFLAREAEVESPQSAQSLVSSWSQLDSGTNSRLEELCLPDTEDLLPCQADTPASCPVSVITQLPDLENSQELQEKLFPNNCDINDEEKEIIEEEEDENEEEKKDICDKENCTPEEEAEDTEIKTGKKKNKKRRKHAKKKPQAPLVDEAEAGLT